MADWRRHLRQGIESLAIEVSESERAQLEAFAVALARWNKVYNLTAIRDPGRIATHHLLDSLSIVPHLVANPGFRGAATRIIDLGSGGGLPGIPVAIVSGAHVILVDKSEKKVRFLTQMCADLGLPHASAVHARMQDVQDRVDFVLCRAFGSLAEIVSVCRGRLVETGAILAMRGHVTAAEIGSLPVSASDSPGMMPVVINSPVPQIDETRNLVVIPARFVGDPASHQVQAST